MCGAVILSELPVMIAGVTQTAIVNVQWRKILFQWLMKWKSRYNNRLITMEIVKDTKCINISEQLIVPFCL